MTDRYPFNQRVLAARGSRLLTSALCLAQTLAMGLAFSKRTQRGKRAGGKSTGGKDRPTAPDLQGIDC